MRATFDLTLRVQFVLDNWLLIAAHGNSLRALTKFLDKVSDDDIVELEIPTGQPLVYELDDALRPTKHYYLAS